MRIDGRHWRQHAGNYVARAGDVNGDGLDDVLIGDSEGGHRSPGSAVWSVYVVFGRREARGAVVRLDRLGDRGLRIFTRHAFGLDAGAGAGDVNGDGLDDIVLGPGPGAESGSVYVVFGRRRGGTVDIDHLGRAGRVITGPPQASHGWAVAGAGDLDRDGYADILVAQPQYVPAGGEFGTGRVVVVYGSRQRSSVDTRRLGSITQIIGPGPFKAVGSAGPGVYGVGFGNALAGAGDTSGDRRGDVLIGAPWLGRRVGGAFVMGPWRRGATIDLRRPADRWYRLDGAGSDAAGYAVAPAGDQNGDGLRDLLIGTLAGSNDLASSHGPSDAYVVFGTSAPGDVRLGDLGSRGAVLHDTTSGDRAGESVASVGTVTGDGPADLLVGAPLADPGNVNAGSAFLVPGGAPAGTHDLRDLPGRGARRFDGRNRSDTAGWSVAGLGDVNGDHRRDIAIAAPRTDYLNSQSGSVYVIYR